MAVQRDARQLRRRHAEARGIINDIKRNIDGEKIFVGEKVYVDNKDRETLMLLERYNASRIPPAPPIKVEPMKMPVGLIFYLDYTYNGEEVK